MLPRALLIARPIMSTVDSGGAVEPQPSPATVGMSKSAFMTSGLILAVLGVFAIIFPFVTGLSLSIFLGALLVVGALVHVANAFSQGKWTGAVWQLVLAIVYAVAGIGLMANPVVGLTTLTILVIVYLVVSGIAEVALGFVLRGNEGYSWGVMVLSGVISILLGGMLWAGLPSSALWAVGLLFGVSLLTSGLSLVFASRRVDQLSEATPPQADAV